MCFFNFTKFTDEKLPQLIKTAPNYNFDVYTFSEKQGKIIEMITDSMIEKLKFG